MFGLTYAEGTTLLGAGLAVGVSVLDAGAMHAFGVDMDKGLLWAGLGALLGAVPAIGTRMALSK